MAADQDFQDIFRETDLLLVVDEWKGFKLESPARILGARAFTNTQRSTAQLYRLLAENGASDWHASGKRSEKSFLFESPAFDAIMQELDRTDTCSYSYLERDLTFFRPGGPADANWRRIMAENPLLAGVWDVDAPHAKSLFWFLDCWVRCLRPRLGPEIRVRIVVDQQDWFSDRRLSEFRPGLAHMGVTDVIQAEVLGMTDKSSSAVAPYLPFLGLVDSEAWAFGRLLSLKVRDGKTVHDRYMERAASGPFAEEDIVISGEAWADMFEAHHKAHEQLRRYWVILSNWPETKNVDVNHALGAVEWQYASE